MRGNFARSTIYVALRDEGTDVWRPVEAERTSHDSFRIVSDMPDDCDERWEFPTGSVVRCEYRSLSDGPVLVAVATWDRAE